MSREAASQWYRAWSTGGRQALAGAGRAGRLPRLSDEQVVDIQAALLEGPQANGFATDLWTLARVADVIEAMTGVRYSQTQTWEILRKRMGWTRQRPERRAVERDDEAIATWVKQEWPRIKKVPAAGEPGSFQDESGVSLLPVVRATWAPRGRTPVLHHHFRWSRLSMSAALAYRYNGSDAALVFEIRSGAYNTESLIEFLTAFHEHFAGEKVTLIWDGLPSHRSKVMNAIIGIHSQRRWLIVERLPGCAPDLTPVELLWGNVKSVELANLCPERIEDARAAAEAGLERAGTSSQLCFNFLAHTGLSL